MLPNSLGNITLPEHIGALGSAIAPFGGDVGAGNPQTGNNHPLNSERLPPVLDPQSSSLHFLVKFW